jgi:hypothetical protein
MGDQRSARLSISPAVIPILFGILIYGTTF